MMTGHYDASELAPSSTKSPYGTDGALERMLRIGHRPKAIPAIFIHAGAGFHSHQNEHVHLEACVAAAEMGMKFLKNGASATQAVEAALRVLEDKEITNAGYGSNLSINGTVECDATVVDHLGRSGACGAVPNIRNPISLAKLILDLSNQPLSLRRVPPNALIGEGAREFAEEHGMITYPNDFLVSKNARDRFLRWQEDLKRADAKVKGSREATEQPLTGSTHQGCTPCEYETATTQDKGKETPRDHAAAILAGTWNEGQPDSPYAGSPTPESSASQSDATAHGYFRGMMSPRSAHRANAGSPQTKHAGSPQPRQKLHKKKLDPQPPARDRGHRPASEDTQTASRDGSASPQRSCPRPPSDVRQLERPQGIKRPSPEASQIAGTSRQNTKRRFRLGSERDDFITDTIGAIAIDDKGQIAAGSSSGGIGMKHRGRLGPAALVGIGTAVVPCAEDDEDGITVASVTSGTGEHMATTMAAQRCAERIYNSTRRGPRGADIQEDDDDAVIESFIADDFMNHPGVKNCYSAGAIGVMVVKKSRTGYYLYFAHNTDSFALASMGANEKEPRCTMSRLSDGAKIAKGGRKVRID